MTEKLVPKALILLDFEFEEKDTKRLQQAAGLTFSKKNIQDLTLAFGSYLAGTILCAHGVLPSEAEKTLKSVRRSFSKLNDIFEKMFGFDGSDVLFAGSLGVIPEILNLPFDIKKKHGLQYVPSFAERKHDTNQYMAVANLINYRLALATDNEFDLDYVYGILGITLKCIQDASENIDSARGRGGRIGDPNFTVFLIDLLNVICADLNRGEYDMKTVDFIDESRLVIADRLEKMGETKASNLVKDLHKDNIISRIQDALKEDARTFQRYRAKEADTRSRRPSKAADD